MLLAGGGEAVERLEKERERGTHTRTHTHTNRYESDWWMLEALVRLGLASTRRYPTL